MPSYAQVTVNGHTLDESFLEEDEESYFFEGHLPKGVSGFKLVHYSFDYAFGEPEVLVQKITDEEQGTAEPVALQDLNDGLYRYEFTYDDEEAYRQQFEKKALGFLETWCKFANKKANKKDVTALCIPGSKAVEHINGYDAYWAYESKNQTFEDERCWNYMMIDGQVVCCEVYGKYIIETKAKAVPYREFPTHFRLYFYKYQGDWRIYDFEQVYDAQES